ncbi:MAG: hypothetical protein QW652_06510 [Candidatus Nitrosotenuis sp.]
MVSPKADFTAETKMFSQTPPHLIAKAKVYYDMGLTAEQTYQQPGTPSRSITQKLFRFWNQQFLEEYDTVQLNDRQVIAKGRLRTAISEVLFKFNYQLNLIEAQVEAEKQLHLTQMDELARAGKSDRIKPYKVNVSLESLRTKILQEITNCLDMLAECEIRPTAYEVQDTKILMDLNQRQEELRKKIEQMGQGNRAARKGNRQKKNRV